MLYGFLLINITSSNIVILHMYVILYKYAIVFSVTVNFSTHSLITHYLYMK